MVCGASQHGDAGHVSGTETLSSRPKRLPCVGAHRQHSGGLLYQPPGRSAFTPLVQAGAPDPCVVPGQAPLAESSTYSWASQYGSRHPVEAGAEVVKQIWRVFGQAQVDLFATRQTSHCPLWFSLTHPAPLGHGTDLAEDRLYAFPSIALLPGVLERVRQDGVRLLLVAPFWLGRVWFSDLISLLDGSSWEIPVRRDLLTQAEGMILHPRHGVVETGSVAPEGAHLIASGLSTEVVETIFQSRAPSTRKLYALKWRLFTSWCGDRQLDPVNCLIGTVLEFLQARFSAGLTHSTLKVYVLAIAAYPAPLGGLSVGKNPLVTRFLRGVMRLRPQV